MPPAETKGFFLQQVGKGKGLAARWRGGSVAVKHAPALPRCFCSLC